MMKKFILPIILFCTINAHAINVGLLTGSSPSPEAPDTACIGYLDEQTNCAYSEDPPSYIDFSSDRTVTYKWVTTQELTISRIKVEFVTGSYDAVQAVVYDNLDLIGTATIIPAAGWVWSGTFVAEPGHSLTVSNGTTLYFGISVDTTASFRMGRISDSSTPNYHYYSSYMPDPIPVWLPASTSEIAIILEYNY